MAAMMRRYWQQEAAASGLGLPSAVAGRPQVRHISSATLRQLQESNGALTSYKRPVQVRASVRCVCQANGARYDNRYCVCVPSLASDTMQPVD